MGFEWDSADSDSQRGLVGIFRKLSDLVSLSGRMSKIDMLVEINVTRQPRDQSQLLIHKSYIKANTKVKALTKASAQ